VQCCNGCIGLVGSFHRDEAKATRFARAWIGDQAAIGNLAVARKLALDIGLGGAQ